MQPTPTYTSNYVKRLTRHGSDAVLYIPRPLQRQGWKEGIYITMRGDHEAKIITLQKLQDLHTSTDNRPGPHGRDRRATNAPEI